MYTYMLNSRVTKAVSSDIRDMKRQLETVAIELRNHQSFSSQGMYIYIYV
jgi:hypothetical protein